MKRTLMLTLVFLLTMGSAAYGMPSLSGSGIDTSNLPTLNAAKPVQNLPERLVNPENPNEQVRIIVELDKAPAIEEATKKGLLYKELPSSQKNAFESAVESDQRSVQATVTSVAPTIEYLDNFTTVFNGFSAEVDAKSVESIASLPGVKAVYESTEYQRPVASPQMTYSEELVQAQKAWNDYGFRGEGMVVGIIDTGIDPSHKDMVLTDEETGKITEGQVNALLADGSIDNGMYFTAKVPFGYNYMDGNNEILDLGPEASMHGMHVAGTVGANGGKDGIKGIAPEAQLLALKVFGNDPLFGSTFGDIYIKAIDDAIKLGVDVINMSLGSVAGYVDANNPEQQAVKRATENGVLVAISAGNSDMYGSGYFYPYAENQDYGVTGSPSVSYDSLGVASIENSHITAYSFTYEFDEAEEGRALYLLANDVAPQQETYEIVHAGLGKPEEFEGKDFTGKYALVSRGEIAFTEKGLNAQAAGAAGVIIYNNAVGTINMVSDSAIKIPYMSALKSDGDAMKAGLDAEKTVTVTFDGEFLEVDNPEDGSMSSFTSWGPTPNLDFKPEITAPGGNIFSTLNNDQYGLMSGTSMAAPHVAGGAALIFERVDKEFEATFAERVKIAKNLLMNTALPVELNDGEYVSPRRQGAGLMQLANALSTDVIVTNKATGEAKVALKEIKDDQFTFTLEAKNYSNEEKTYNVDVQVQMDVPANAGGVFINLPNNPAYGQFVLDEFDADLDFPESITIPANGTAELTVTADASFIADLFDIIYTNGFFLDGFVILTDNNEEVSGNVPLVVPFYGFNGEWDDAPLFDYFAWDSMTYWGYTALADEQGEFISGGGEFDTSRFGFSPNGDGIRDKAIPAYSLFRNAKNFKVAVLDSEENELRTIRTATNLRKHYTNTAPALPYTYSTNYAWDGMVNGELVEDGDYYIELSGVIDFEGAEWQSIKFPVKVDTVAPTAEVLYDTATKTISVSDFVDNENGTGAYYWEILVNGKAVEDFATEALEYVIEEEISWSDIITVRIWDAAYNFTDYRFFEGEETHPVIYIISPGFFSVYDTNTVVVEGEIEDESDVVTVTVNGEEAEFDGVNFTHTLTLEDGVRDIRVEAIDKFDNVMQIARKIFVDATGPTITVKNPPAKVNGDSVKVTVNVQDNFEEVGVYMNGSEIFRNELSSPYAMRGYSKDIEVELKLVDGKNNFTFEVEDLAGHKASQTITIEKTDKVVDNPGNGGGGNGGGGVVTPPVDPKPEEPKPDPILPHNFKDIVGTYAEMEISSLAALGIIMGKTADTFGPNDQITRAQFAILLARTLQLPKGPYVGTFSDVTENMDWAVYEIEAANRAGIVTGSNGKFRPYDPITRQQMAAMIIRAIEFYDASFLDGVSSDIPFADADSIHSYAKEYVGLATSLGIINGRASGDKRVFAPNENATRAHAAIMLYSALKLFELKLTE